MTADAGDGQAREQENAIQQYQERYRAALRQLFEAAKAVEEVQYALALNPEFRGAQDAGWSTAEDAVLAVDDYSQLLERLPNGRTRLRVALSLYLHLSESSGLYETIKNMLRITTGEDYSIWPFLPLAERRQTTGAIIAPNVSRVMKDLLGHAQEARMNLLGETIADTFDPELRHAQAHADYILWDDGIRVRRRNGGRPMVISYEDFTFKLNKALSFFHMLRETSTAAVREYTEPRRVIGRTSSTSPRLPSIIHFDEERGSFSVRQGLGL